jgi:hypothetical protein
LSVFEYRTTFYKLSAEGLDGDATRIGLEILQPKKLPWKGETWAITQPVTQVLNDIEITAATLSRSREAELHELEAAGPSMHLESYVADTNDFIPIAFFHVAHVFAIPWRPRFPTQKVVRVLRNLAPATISDLLFYPLLEDKSLRERLKQYQFIRELVFNIVRANPESPHDSKLFNDRLRDSHIKRYLLRLIGDARGLDIESEFVNQQIAYVEDGLGALTSGKAINEAGIEEVISGKKFAPKAITIESTDEPTDFAGKLAQNSPIAGVPQKQLETGQ